MANDISGPGQALEVFSWRNPVHLRNFINTFGAGMWASVEVAMFQKNPTIQLVGKWGRLVGPNEPTQNCLSSTRPPDGAYGAAVSRHGGNSCFRASGPHIPGAASKVSILEQQEKNSYMAHLGGESHSKEYES